MPSRLLRRIACTLLVVSACTPFVACSPEGTLRPSPQSALGARSQDRLEADFDSGELAQAAAYETERTSDPLRGDAADTTLETALNRACKRYDEGYETAYEASDRLHVCVRSVPCAVSRGG